MASGAGEEANLFESVTSLLATQTYSVKLAGKRGSEAGAGVGGGWTRNGALYNSLSISWRELSSLISLN